MNYTLIKSKLKPEINNCFSGYRTFSFTLPSNKKDCVAEGKTIINGNTMEVFSLNYRITLPNKKYIFIDWITPTINVDASKEKFPVDRSEDFVDTIRKRTKKFDKKDTKRIIDAFEHDYTELFKDIVMAMYKQKSKKKK